MEKIELYCRRCRKFLHIVYNVTGDPESPVLPNVVIKCACCTRLLIFKNANEEQIVAHIKNGKCYI